jgi:valyl-tRNA synthetase
VTALPAQYDAQATEGPLYRRWVDAGCFTADPARTHRAGFHGDREPFVVPMPPPNVTAVLHVGHGLNDTVQDVVVRWRRMRGDEVLWIPGTDHAGIATQNVVERQLAAEGTSRPALGREAFAARTAAFVAETGGIILEQLKALGASADWTRTAYTFSPKLSRAVREAFVRLFDEGLIYRGHRVIHWCPRCLTSLSDEEAEFEDEVGQLWHIRYPLASDPTRGITVATTRPETILGDVAVAVHPDDERYRDLIGQSVTLPIVGIAIPVIADSAVDPAFGTGAVKITPAHDANDFEIGSRHSLPTPVVISLAATIEEGAGATGRVPERLRGLDRFLARERIVGELRGAGLVVKTETHTHAVRHCYRCGTVVEPRLSDQWFVRMAPLAEPALDALRSGRLRILPERWEAVYTGWLTGIRDWNISRQLWWGHRIPVWYCDGCGSTRALREDPAACPDCGGTLRQDADVLDTWFSAWLWPFSTLGWPDDTPDLRAFYPGDLLITAPEILFFWVARMVMAGLHFQGQIPFRTVYLHGTVRDTEHRKMSKSLGNGIDPLDVIRLYGADALRYTLVAGLGLGTDVVLDPANLEQSFAPGRHFVTKLWNIGRFILTSVGDESVEPGPDFSDRQLTRADHWILARLDGAVAACTAALGPVRPPSDGVWPTEQRGSGLRLSEYAESARAFVWNDLADWYVEHCKRRLGADADAADRVTARSVLVHVFDTALRLLHPIVPFVTEALWQELPRAAGGPGRFLTRAAWPTVRGTARHAKPAAEYDLARAAVSALRQIRADYRIPPAQSLAAVIEPGAGSRGALAGEADAIGRLARCDVRVGDPAPDGASALTVLADGSTVIVPLAGVIDVEKECARLRGELAQTERLLAGVRQRLGTAAFTDRAKPEVVEGARSQERDLATREGQLRTRVEVLCGP